MATTSEYFDYLDQEIGIAPANSQEELQASELIAGLFSAHNLETRVQEFDTSASAPLIRAILEVLLLVGVVLSAMSSVTVLGVLITLVCAALLLADSFGYDILSKVGAPACSQNVIAYHPATGDLVTKGSRRIVIMAHYDTPHENILSRDAFAPYQAIIRRVAFWCVPATALLAILQLFFGAATTGRRVVWLLALLAALPVLLVGVAQIIERFAPCTEGANDNKASVAALLGIMDKVSPSDIQLEIRPRPKKIVMTEDSYGVRHGKEVVEELGMLPEGCELVYSDHDTDVFDIDVTEPITDDAAPSEELNLSTGEFSGDDIPDEEKTVFIAPENGEPFVVEASLGGAPDMSDPEDWHPSEAVDDAGLIGIPVIDPSTGMTGVAAAGAPVSGQGYEGEDALYTGDGDDTGILTLAADDEEGLGQRIPNIPASPDDPSWGTSEFEPDKPNVARRAVLFDLPSPDRDDADGLAVTDLPEIDVADGGVANDAAPENLGAVLPQIDTDAQSINRSVPDAAQDATFEGALTEVIPSDELHEADGAAAPRPSAQERTERKRGIFFGRKKKQNPETLSEWLGVSDDFNAKDDGRAIGNWDNFDDDNWQGGATTDIRFRSQGNDSDDLENEEAILDEAALAEEASQEDVLQDDFRAPESGVGAEGATVSEYDNFDEETTFIDVDLSAEDAPTPEELRDAILSMDNDALIAHDIWFVALGASSLDHAGTDAFLAEYRSQCRGSFVINLDSVGAGALTALTHEGVRDTKRADRRILRLLSTTATALNIHLAQESHAWGDTDATKAMRSSMRSITLMGLDENGLPAYSQTHNDTYENVMSAKLNNVVELVTELIRRS